jgi:AP-3 complex subunit beta
MNENSTTVDIPQENNTSNIVSSRVHEVANVLQVSTADEKVYRFAGKTVSAGCDVLITVKFLETSKAQVIVNCDKLVIGSMLLKDVKVSLSKPS